MTLKKSNLLGEGWYVLLDFLLPQPPPKSSPDLDMQNFRPHMVIWLNIFAPKIHNVGWNWKLFFEKKYQ